MNASTEPRFPAISFTFFIIATCFAIACLITSGLLAITSSMPASPVQSASLTASPTSDPTTNPIPPCTTEDTELPSRTSICFWDARNRGNGLGRSYILVKRDDTTTLRRITHRRAHRLTLRWTHS